MRATPYTYAATLIRIVDADTVILQLDLGLRLTATMPIRLLGINAPEMNTAAGTVSRQWVVDWFQAHPQFRVDTAKDPEKYGRWLGVIRPESGASLNEALVTAGHAVPYMT